MLRTSLLAALVFVGSVSACRRSEDAAAAGDRPDRESATGQALAESEIDRLRALPYAGYAEVPKGQEADRVVIYDPRRSYPGYNLCIIADHSKAELFDAHGRVLRTWEHRPSKFWQKGELLPNGDFVVVGEKEWKRSKQGRPEDDDAAARYALCLSWNGEVLWQRQLASHHDLAPAPGGQLVALTFQLRQIPEVHPEIQARDDELTLLSQEGEVLDSLALYDVVRARPDVFPFLSVRPIHLKLKGFWWVDLFHANSVEWMHHKHLVGRHPIYELGNVLICSRNQNRVAVLNWDRRELVWAWGERELSGPHDAHVLANGNILVFDNGLGRMRSRVVEMDPLSGEIVWQYAAPSPTDFYTVTRGANQRLANGNTLITNSEGGQAFEVTPEGEVVWEFRCPYRNEKGQRATIVETKRYEPAYVERIQALFEPAAEQAAP